MSKSSYKNAEGAFGAAGIAASAVGASATFGNPMGGVQNAQAAYHEHQFKKGVRRYFACRLGSPAVFEDSIFADTSCVAQGRQR